MARGSKQWEDDAVVLEILSAVERRPKLTQRHVASELGIALGLVNGYLRRCVRKGLVKVSEAPARRYAYYLTPEGFSEKSRLAASYLSHSFEFFRKARSQCEDIFAHAEEMGQKRIVLVGSGDLADVARLVANEFVVEIVAKAGAHGLGKLSKDLAAASAFDCAVVVSLTDASAFYAACEAQLGAGKVYAPPLLRISQATPVPERRRVSHD